MLVVQNFVSLFISVTVAVSAYAVFWACWYRFPSEPVKVIDLRTGTSRPSRCVSFCSSLANNPHGFPGHCYVAWSAAPPTNFADVESIGFVPEFSKDQLPSMWRDVPGVVIPHAALGNLRNLNTLSVLIDETQFEQLHNECLSGTRKRFRVGQSDCVQYTHQIANSLGLSTPNPSYKFPQDYIRRLKQLNN